MRSRIIFLSFFVVVLVAATIAWFVWGQRYTLVFTQQQLEEKLFQKFPFEKNYFHIVGLRFEKPVLRLQERSNRLTFGCDVITNLTVELKDQAIPGHVRGSATISGLIRYEPEQAEFYLDEPVVETIDVRGIPAKWDEKLRAAAAMAAREFLSKAPIYRLKPTDVKKRAALLVLRKVTVVDGKLLVELGVG